MHDHAAQIVIVIPTWAIWMAAGMWTISAALTAYEIYLRRRKGEGRS